MLASRTADGNVRVVTMAPAPAAISTAPDLLVSVSCAVDAAAALAGGADIVDAKDPVAGALGAVTLPTFRAIHAAVGGARPVTAALGDATDEPTVEATAGAFAAAGAALVKVGFAGVTDVDRAAALGAAAVRGAARGSAARGSAARGGALGAGVVLVAYADGDRVGSLDPAALVGVAVAAGARGVLLDTADKGGPGLLGCASIEVLVRWVGEAHAAGLLVALAGRLTPDDVARLLALAPDVVGVRGAACDGGRTGRVSTARVRALRAITAPAPTPKSTGHAAFAER